MAAPLIGRDPDGLPRALLRERRLSQATGAAGAAEVFEYARAEGVDAPTVAAVIRAIQTAGLSVTLWRPDMPGAISRVRFEAYGSSAEDVAATLHEYAQRCDAASGASECSQGTTVIERNLEEEEGTAWAWQGRLTQHPSLGGKFFRRDAVPTMVIAARHMGSSDEHA